LFNPEVPVRSPTDDWLLGARFQANNSKAEIWVMLIFTFEEVNSSHGPTSDFAHTIHKDACDHAFFGYKGFEGVDYGINPLRPDWYELRFDGLTIALMGDKEELERCQEVHHR